MKKSNKICAVVIIVVLVILLSAFIACVFLYNAVTDTSEAYKINTTPSTTIYKPMVKSVILGEPEEITDNDVNGIIAKIINSATDDNENVDNQVADNSNNTPTVLVKGASIYMQGDNIAKLYVDLDYKGNKIIFSANTHLQLDAQAKTITINLSDTKLGRLAVPTEFITGQISLSLEEISDEIQVNKNSIILPSEYNFEFLGKPVTLYIADLQVTQGSATIQTNSAMDIISQFIDEVIDGLFN
ncbi:MAG: hypothetical protein UH241_08795 [Acutalibacteraceae bacterium]|nr:hypothetical protein [Acutalibacteraceae bacterium]